VQACLLKSFHQVSDLKLLPPSPSGEYCCQNNLDLYNNANCQELATQAATGRQMQILSARPLENAVLVRLCEDGYNAWLPVSELNKLAPAETPYRAVNVSRRAIEARLTEIVAFTKAAMAVPNHYLWGGTVAPNYDCSGLMQAAFAASGIWLPRDSYQQEAFVSKITKEELLCGDLIFFGEKKVNHVALYLGEGYYIHSSGKKVGRDGIAIDLLADTGDEVSRGYFQRLWSFGRVMSSYQSEN
jgi:cell wall-associated NlpC family hydrolase